MTEQQIEQIIQGKLGTELPKLKRKWFLLGSLTVLLVPLTIWAATITKPHTFSDGDTLSASKLNENFDTLYTRVNELDSLLPVALSWAGINPCQARRNLYQQAGLNATAKYYRTAAQCIMVR